ncbi:Hypothetical protein (plasmid) [Pseudomonas putida]|nr:Hypothetical protein [Pseudomonas putida]
MPEPLEMEVWFWGAKSTAGDSLLRRPRAACPDSYEGP